MKNSVAFLLIVALFLCLPLTARAQGTPDLSESATSQNGLTVTGHAEIDAKPDVAYADLGVVVQAPAQADAVAMAATKSAAVKAALIKAGVLDDDIKTDYYQVSPQYDDRTTPSVLVGYQVSNFFKVAIHNLPKAGVIVDRATDAGANQVNGVTFDLIDRDSVEGQALAAAVTNARSKADLMAGAAGVTLGRLINLTETSNDQSLPRPMFFAAARAAAAPDTTPIQQQDIVITSDVTAFYAIGYGK